jgi:hypothetical protein
VKVGNLVLLCVDISNVRIGGNDVLLAEEEWSVQF